MGSGTGSYHHGDLRTALLEAAREIVEERSHDRLSLRGVASRVGVSHMAPYHHFADKRALLAAVAAEGYRELAGAMSRRVERSEDPRGRLREVGVAYVRFAVEHPGLFRLMFSGMLSDDREHPELAAAGREAASMLARALRALGGDGGDEPGRLAGNEDALRAWSLVHGLASLILDGQVAEEVSPEEAEALAYRVLGGGPAGG